MTQVLEPSFDVVTAPDGISALEVAIETLPDLYEAKRAGRGHTIAV